MLYRTDSYDDHCVCDCTRSTSLRGVKTPPEWSDTNCFNFFVLFKMTPSKSQAWFSPQEDIKLAELVSQNPCIFDVEHTLYKNQGVRDNVWQKISEDMNKNLDDCRKRWRNMKDTYNKHKRNRKLGTIASAKSKSSKWALSHVLSFLDVSYERECSSSMQSLNEHIKEEDNSVVEDTEIQELNDTSLPSTSGSYVDLNKQRDILRPRKRKLNTEKWPAETEKQNEELITMFKKGSEEQKIIFEKMNKVKEEDPIDTLFKSMASTVKTFTPSLKIRAKKEVFNIINNLEFENYSINESTSRKNDNAIENINSSLSTQSSE